jgi:alpha-mannosidase
LIVRAYEDQRNRGKVAMKAGFTVARAYRCNLLEENETELSIADNHIQFDITPYQIITLRLIPKS